VRAAAVTIVAALAALAATGSAARAADGYCCVTARLVVSYDAGAHRISARWGNPVAGASSTEIRAGDRLGADGVVDLASPRTVRARVDGANAISVGAGKLALVLATHASGFVQVRFACSAKTASRPCATGAFWSRPVQVTAEPAEPAKKDAPPIDSTQQRVQIKSNGTQACLEAFAALRSVIADLNANTADAKKAAAAGKSTSAFAAEQRRLKARFDKLYAAAKRACAPP
jgi:hypothetical protein